jgi:NADH-quinone oxidoreductase subunit B
MLGARFYASTLSRLLAWARSRSLWYVYTGSGCCADEVMNLMGCRYDLERFGCVPQSDPKQADLLIVSGLVSEKASSHLKDFYESMLTPRYVLALGACVNGASAFYQEANFFKLQKVSQIIPVDVYVPGCPPRPEAIMNGIITLQEKICGQASTSF